METEVIQRLLELNRHFYHSFGSAFAATRQRVQPGVKRILEMFPNDGDWLDVGCGGGALAAALRLHSQHGGRYVGIDFSQPLLAEARRLASKLDPHGDLLQFHQADLALPGWDQVIAGMTFDVVLALAVLHHIPGKTLRQQIIQRIREHLKPGGAFVHSEWQLQHSPRLTARLRSWGEIGLADDQVEAGDVLMDWRYALPGQAEQVGLRYVHLFKPAELQDLADSCEFKVVQSFESDGKGGRLGLYQVWQIP